MVVYKNESFLIEDKVREYFKECYKHLDLSIMYEETNDLITGYYITIKEDRLMMTARRYTSTENIESYKELIDKIMENINDAVSCLLKRYYTA